MSDMSYEESERIVRFAYFKSVNFTDFNAFFHSLPLREKCMAVVMYFGTITLYSVIRMSKSEFDISKFPKYTHKYFEKYEKERNGEYILLFTNRNGGAVHRTQVANAFERASQECMKRITPNQLYLSSRLTYWNLNESVAVE